jgi:hypothetical protein
VHNAVRTIRRALADLGLPDAIESGSFGYQATVDPACVDAVAFEEPGSGPAVRASLQDLPLGSAPNGASLADLPQGSDAGAIDQEPNATGRRRG